MNVETSQLSGDRRDQAPGADCPNINLVGRRTGRVEQLQSQVGSLLKTIRIAVVYGGDKNEDGSVIYKSCNPRSWKSYQIVARDIVKRPRRQRHARLFLIPATKIRLH